MKILNNKREKKMMEKTGKSEIVKLKREKY